MVRHSSLSPFLGFLDEVLSSVARTIATTERMKVRVDWLDRVIRDIRIRRDRLVLSQRVEQLEARLMELLGESERVRQELEQVCTKKSIKVLPSSLIDNDKICILAEL